MTQTSGIGAAPVSTATERRLELVLKLDRAATVLTFFLGIWTLPSLIACLGPASLDIAYWPPGAWWWLPAIAAVTACVAHPILMWILVPPRTIAHLDETWGYYFSGPATCGTFLVIIFLVRHSPGAALLPILVGAVLIFAVVKTGLDDVKWGADKLADRIRSAQSEHEYSVAQEFLSGYWKHISQLGDPPLNRPPATSQNLCLQYRQWCARVGHKLSVDPFTGTTESSEALMMGVADHLLGERQADIARCAASLGTPFWRLNYDGFVAWCRKNNEAPRGADIFEKAQQAMRSEADRDTEPFENWFAADSRARCGHDEATVPTYKQYLAWCEAGGHVPEYRRRYDERMENLGKTRATAGIRTWLKESFHEACPTLPRYADYAEWVAYSGRQLAAEVEYQVELRRRVVPLARAAFQMWLEQASGTLLAEYEQYVAWCEENGVHLLTAEEFLTDTAPIVAARAVKGWHAFRRRSPGMPPREVYSPYCAWCTAARQYVLSARDVSTALAIEADPWSYGVKPCPTCKGRMNPRSGCPMCGGAGRINGRFVETGERELTGYGESQGGLSVPIYDYKKVYVSEPCSCTICTTCRGKGTVRVRWSRTFKPEDTKDRPSVPKA